MQIKVPFRKLKHIHHISDIQIRNLKRHKEYEEVFDRLYEKVKENKDNAVAYIGGDIAHSKCDMSPELVDQLSRLFKNLADIVPTIIIAGKDFGMLNKLKNLTKKHGLEKRIIFRGKISENEKIKLFSEATIFVHPSLEDVFSLSLIEAAGSGVPSIAFDIEANSEILENNCGMIVKNPTVSSLANTIDYLLEHDDERNEISKNASNLIPKKYDWNNTAKILEQFYFQLK